ncbi:hypothetical protein ONZ43_g1015 [Nemania bipapillata]|uniref:Uncharacterized protein n=1 Tax=Nemania bipapillata TaxID=110536 RepID=A0ACC2J631_9PEZI|nr:hypothetical protein ONZ43_g1015 [Nemania bipapillata]
MSALDIVLSRRHRPKPIEAPAPAPRLSLRDILCGSPDAIIEKTDTKAPHDNEEVQHDKSEVECDVKAQEGLRWADDPDLPPIPEPGQKPARDSAPQCSNQVSEGPQTSQTAEPKYIPPGHVTDSNEYRDFAQKCGGGSAKGLQASRWAIREESPPPAVTENKPQTKKGAAQQQSQTGAQGPESSRREKKDLPGEDKKMLENKLKRELAQFGLKTKPAAKKAPEPSQPTARDAPKNNPGPSGQSSSRPANKPKGRRQYDKKPGNSRGNQHRADKEEKKTEEKKTEEKKTEEKKTEEKKEEEDKEEEPKSRLVIFDWEEFNREVKENNLKTLKDSRWAD